MTKEIVIRFFECYKQFYMRSQQGPVDGTEISELYAPELIGASPFGVMTAKNDGDFQKALEQGYVQSRKIGTKGMRVRSVEISPIDELHCTARVAWRLSTRSFILSLMGGRTHVIALARGVHVGRRKTL